MGTTPHPLDPLDAAEVRAAAAACRAAFPVGAVRFCTISLREPAKADLTAYADAAAAAAAAAAATAAAPPSPPPRVAEVLLLTPATGRAHRLAVGLTATGGDGGGGASAVVASREELPAGTQPSFSPEDCTLAEEIVKADGRVRALLRERYGISDVEAELAADPWSVHLTDAHYPPMKWRQGGGGATANGSGNGAAASANGGENSGSSDDGSPGATAGTNVDSPSDSAAIPPRLMQMFLYHRHDTDDNHYAHPLDLLPVVDLHARTVVAIHGAETAPPAGTPPGTCINYHRALLRGNKTLAFEWRADPPAALAVTQPDGPSWRVTGRHVTWQGWSLRVGFNAREGLVLHDVRHGGRRVVDRASLVEMAVPYGDPQGPYPRKCAFDVGDYGLGACANSLSLGCDCLGAIHYFGATLSDAAGEPIDIPRVVCLHEEDAGVGWKHADFRSGTAETRRGRRLILSFGAAVVNYDYAVYWSLGLDGSIDCEVQLTGELSTNTLSAAEVGPGAPATPRYGVLVAPGVNAQVHQHMFCVRLDMAVDGPANQVAEVEVKRLPRDAAVNPAGNAFASVETPLLSEAGAVRDAAPGRAWRISNASSRNPVTGAPVAYKLVRAHTLCCWLMSCSFLLACLVFLCFVSVSAASGSFFVLLTGSHAGSVQRTHVLWDARFDSFPFLRCLSVLRFIEQVPATRGGLHPALLTADDSAVSRRALFACHSLWVTPHADGERYPAGEFPSQQLPADDPTADGVDAGLATWTAADRSLVDTDVVLWHAFGVTHVPRVEDFPVMPVATVGFSLHADGFFGGNPAVDLPPPRVGEGASVCCSEA